MVLRSTAQRTGAWRSSRYSITSDSKSKRLKNESLLNVPSKNGAASHCHYNTCDGVNRSGGHGTLSRHFPHVVVKPHVATKVAILQQLAMFSLVVVICGCLVSYGMRLVCELTVGAWRQHVDQVPAELVSAEGALPDIDRKISRLVDRIENGLDDPDTMRRLEDRRTERRSLVKMIDQLRRANDNRGPGAHGRMGPTVPLSRHFCTTSRVFVSYSWTSRPPRSLVPNMINATSGLRSLSHVSTF